MARFISVHSFASIAVMVFLTSSIRSQEPEMHLPPPRSISEGPAQKTPSGDQTKESPKDGLPLEFFLQMALERNPILLEVQQVIAAAQGRAVQAGKLPNPTVTYQLEGLGARDIPAEFQGGRIDQEIVLGGKLRLDRAIVNQEVVQAEMSAQRRLWAVRNSIHISFIQALACEEGIRIVEKRISELKKRKKEKEGSKKNLEQSNAPCNTETEEKPAPKAANDIETRIKELEDAEKKRKLEELCKKIEELSDEIKKLEKYYESLKLNQKLAWHNLVYLTGARPEELGICAGRFPDLEGSWKKVGDYWFSMILHQEYSGLREEPLRQQSVYSNPALQRALAEITRANLILKRERKERVPNVAIGIQSGYAYGDRRTLASVEIGAAFPLFDRNEGNIAAARAEVVAAQERARQTEFLLNLIFDAAWARFKSHEDHLGRKDEQGSRILYSAVQLRQVMDEDQLKIKEITHPADFFDLLEYHASAIALKNYLVWEDRTAQPFEALRDIEEAAVRATFAPGRLNVPSFGFTGPRATLRRYRRR